MTDSEDPRESILAAQAALLQAAYGAQNAQLLYVAAKLGIADQLRHGHQTAVALARTLGVNDSALQRILRGLATLGVCAENDDGRFSLTSVGEYIRSDHPDSVAPRLLLNGEVHYALWTEILATVRTGEAASQRLFGMPFYDYLANTPAVGALFDRTMASAVRYRHRPAVRAYDFGQFGTIVDVGGGNGALMVEILTASARPTGVVFDVHRLAEGAQQTIEAAGLTARCRFIGGNALEAVPAGGDAYILSNLVLSWEDDEAVVALQNCRKSIVPQGKLLLVEWMIPAADEPTQAFRSWDTVMTDLIMLVTFGSRRGRVRTRSEFQTLLNAAGFAITALVPTRASVWVIEAVPVQGAVWQGETTQAMRRVGC
jgi:SAM-dependent methyltransferase